MILITLKRQKENYLLTIKGHAGYNPGNDIVCAAVSCLTYTLAARLCETGENISPETIVDGNAKIEFRRSHETRCILKTILCGFKLLQHKYPDYISIIGVGAT